MVLCIPIDWQIRKAAEPSDMSEWSVSNSAFSVICYGTDIIVIAAEPLPLLNDELDCDITISH
jgi:hypothetical protein